ncbi:hypothetical protein [Aquimarina sp. MAR_2010_214]|uniref:hypothetical protein n=1 Tax=Aquimarina sp. MAR_2010_214 TaxID=1250026 RepID=UPI000C703DED|nr:hypothetical protein [Aquimarina sp. MAR_2010_214]
MKEYTSIYYKFPILKWFFVFTTLLSFGGYSNYTQPVDFKDTIELLVSPEESASPKNSILFSDVIDQGKSSDSPYIEHKYLVLLSLNHTKLSRVFKKNQSFFICLFHKHKIINIQYNSSYNDKEESFHFNFIG